MSKLPPIPSWIPGSDLLHPTFRYTTPTIPSTVDELHKLFEPKTSLYAFVAMTAFNPIFWNFVARNGVYMFLDCGMYSTLSDRRRWNGVQLCDQERD